MSDWGEPLRPSLRISLRDSLYDSLRWPRLGLLWLSLYGSLERPLHASLCRSLRDPLLDSIKEEGHE